MRTRSTLRALGSGVAAAALALSAAPAMAAGAGQAYTCSGGDIPSGNYSSLTVTGNCQVATGAVIHVSGNVYVAPGAVLDAQHASGTVTIDRNVTAGAGSLVGLGCQPEPLNGHSAHPCTDDETATTTVTVGGNITASNALAFLLNGATVKGNVTFSGGGNDEIPWSIKNNWIAGNLTVTGQTTDWLGVLFNRIGGNVTLTNIHVTDSDDGFHAVYIVRNNVGRNLTCTGLTPAVSGGFVPGSHNTVGGHATGQCAALV